MSKSKFFKWWSIIAVILVVWYMIGDTVEYLNQYNVSGMYALPLIAFKLLVYAIFLVPLVYYGFIEKSKTH